MDEGGTLASSRVPDALRHAVTLRRAGTRTAMGAGSAAHHFMLRCIRGKRVRHTAIAFSAVAAEA